MAETAPPIEACARRAGRCRSAGDAARTVRSLSLLTQTVRHLQRMRAAGRTPQPYSGSNHDDDIPAGIDEFRRDLARRIDAFVESRTALPALTSQPLRRWTTFDSDFMASCMHQEPPHGQQQRAVEPPGDARRRGAARPTRRRVGAGAGAVLRLGSGRCRIALIGETANDVREVMIEGASGLLRVSRRSDRPAWTSTRRRLEWANSAVAEAFSADEPDQLRGPQFDAAWCDELAKWQPAETAFDNLQFGLRLGARPRQLITTTPRPIALLKRLVADPRVAVTRARPRQQGVLSPAFLDEVIGRYAGRGWAARRSTARSSRTDRRAVVARHDEAARVSGAPLARRGRPIRLAGADRPNAAASSRQAAPRTA